MLSTIHFPRVSSILNKAVFRLCSHPNDQTPAPLPFPLSSEKQILSLLVPWLLQERRAGSVGCDSPVKWIISHAWCTTVSLQRCKHKSCQTFIFQWVYPSLLSQLGALCISRLRGFVWFYRIHKLKMERPIKSSRLSSCQCMTKIILTVNCTFAVKVTKLKKLISALPHLKVFVRLRRRVRCWVITPGALTQAREHRPSLLSSGSNQYRKCCYILFYTWNTLCKPKILFFP